MKVKVQFDIEVKDEEEARLIRRGLEDPATRALVKIMGALLPLPERSRADVLTKVFQALE